MPRVSYLDTFPVVSLAAGMSMKCKWEEEHIQTLLDTLLTLKAGFGQGGNPHSSDLHAAMEAINTKYNNTQNKLKPIESVGDKWRTVSAIIRYFSLC